MAIAKFQPDFYRKMVNLVLGFIQTPVLFWMGLLQLGDITEASDELVDVLLKIPIQGWTNSINGSGGDGHVPAL